MTIQQNFEDRDKVKITVSGSGSGFYRRCGKRMLDMTLSLILLPVLLPIITLIAIVIKLDGGPAVFGHKRVGKGGREFKCWKLRSMCTNSETELASYLKNNPEAEREWRENYKLKHDPRITRIGGFIRKTSLDELPQIFNVMAGEMSFVGPRPVTCDELEKYGDAQKAYLSINPGITGLWQVSGRNSLSYQRRVQLDRDYMQSYGLTLDIKILVKTIKVVFTGRSY